MYLYHLFTLSRSAVRFPFIDHQLSDEYLLYTWAWSVDALHTFLPELSINEEGLVNLEYDL